MATNAVLEHRGAKTALVTTAGFRDVLELRRGRTPQSFDLFFTTPPELVERRLRFEVKERIAAAGEVLVDLDEAELHALVESLRLPAALRFALALRRETLAHEGALEPLRVLQLGLVHDPAAVSLGDFAGP